jgi:hypothetical protein
VELPTRRAAALEIESYESVTPGETLTPAYGWRSSAVLLSLRWGLGAIIGANISGIQKTLDNDTENLYAITFSIVRKVANGRPSETQPVLHVPFQKIFAKRSQDYGNKQDSYRSGDIFIKTPFGCGLSALGGGID